MQNLRSNSENEPIHYAEIMPMDRESVLTQLREMSRRGMNAEIDKALQDSPVLTLSAGGGDLLKMQADKALNVSQPRLEHLMGIFETLETELLQTILKGHLKHVAPVRETMMLGATLGTPYHTFACLVGYHVKNEWQTQSGVPEGDSGEDLSNFIQFIMDHLEIIMEAPEHSFDIAYNVVLTIGRDFDALLASTGKQKDHVSALMKVSAASWRVHDDRFDPWSTIPLSGNIPREIGDRIISNPVDADDFIAYLKERKAVAGEADWGHFELHRALPAASLRSGVL